MNIIKLTDTLAVSAQITPADVAVIAEAGYRVLINNRPDGEETTQPANADIEAAAVAAGLEYHHLPCNARDFPGNGFADMRNLLDDPERPVLAFCRTGTRCTNLWVASCDEAGRARAIDTGRQLGFDLSLALRLTGHPQG